MNALPILVEKNAKAHENGLLHQEEEEGLKETHYSQQDACCEHGSSRNGVDNKVFIIPNISITTIRVNFKALWVEQMAVAR